MDATIQSVPRGEGNTDLLLLNTLSEIRPNCSRKGEGVRHITRSVKVLMIY